MVIPASSSAAAVESAPSLDCTLAHPEASRMSLAAASTPAGAAPGRNVFHAAEQTAEFFDHLRTHYRESRRQPVEIPAAVRLLLEDGGVYDCGTAVLCNLSPSGALLGRVKLSRGSYPVQAFMVEIVLQGCEYEGIGIQARPIRFEPKSGGLGVKFEEIFVAV